MVRSTPLPTRDLSRRAHSKANATGPQEGSGRAGVLAEIEVDLCAVLVAVVRRFHGAEDVAVGGTEVVDLLRVRVSVSYSYFFDGQGQTCTKGEGGSKRGYRRPASSVWTSLP